MIWYHKWYHSSEVDHDMMFDIIDHCSILPAAAFGSPRCVRSLAVTPPCLCHPDPDLAETVARSTEAVCALWLRGRDWRQDIIILGRSSRSPWAFKQRIGSHLHPAYCWQLQLALSRWSGGARQDEPSRAAGGGSIEESGEGGDGDGGELHGGSEDCSLATVLPYIACTFANKAWCCEALASRRLWHMRILSGVFFLLPWASFLLHGMRWNYGSNENIWCHKSLLKQNGFHDD
jgi:hypothetical protein